ncbi:MAG: Hsp20/alpha crystallin family protein [Bacteroidia bacterium]|nr:Hsp20/alpha crystallin family protein [Bacteroidia bacterium]
MSLLVNKKGDGFMRPFGSLISDLFDDNSFWEKNFIRGVSFPAVNVRETNENFEIEMAIPGLRKEDMDIKIENGMLTISSEKKSEREEKEENFTRKEFNYSSFLRSFSLPENVDQEDINASYAEGILTVVLAKKEDSLQPPPKYISID